jgi:beta-barrel assembly-enhancing protease
MKKIIIEIAITIFLFFGTWFALSQIDWVRVFKIQEVTDKTEQKLGELFWDYFQNSEKVNKNIHVRNSIDSIVNHICKANKIDREKLKIHILNKDDINAFALPNGHILIYSGLILNSDNHEELTGVICHEIAHIELDHVMKKLIKEIGLSVLISMTTGSGGSDMVKDAAKILSSTAFDRSLEREADIKAVDYMIAAKVDPGPLANFLYKLAEKEHEATKYLRWISTHPDTKERAEYIIEYSNSKQGEYTPILSDATWEKLKDELKK